MRSKNVFTDRDLFKNCLATKPQNAHSRVRPRRLSRQVFKSVDALELCMILQKWIKKITGAKTSSYWRTKLLKRLQWIFILHQTDVELVISLLVPHWVLIVRGFQKSDTCKVESPIWSLRRPYTILRLAATWLADETVEELCSIEITLSMSLYSLNLMRTSFHSDIPISRWRIVFRPQI